MPSITVAETIKDFLLDQQPGHIPRSYSIENGKQYALILYNL